MDRQETLVPRKKRGPQPTGQGVQIQVRAHDDMLSAIDNWIAGHGVEGMSRPQAVRELVARGLKSDTVLKTLLAELGTANPPTDAECAAVLDHLRKFVLSTLK